MTQESMGKFWKINWNNCNYYAYRNSHIFRRMSAGWRPFPDAVILADSAYPLNDFTIPKMPISPPGYEALFRFRYVYELRIFHFY